MSEESTADMMLTRAKKQEECFDWAGAASSYRKAGQLVPKKDSQLLAEICESQSYALYKAAFQSEDTGEFEKRSTEAIEGYRTAKNLYASVSDEQEAGREHRCEAMGAFIASWLASEPEEKRRLLNDCWRLTKTSLEAYRRGKNELEYGKTFNQLSNSVDLAFSLETNRDARQRMLNEAVERGERAIEFLAKLESPHELGKAYARTCTFLNLLGILFEELENRQKKIDRAREYWHKARTISEEEALLEMLTVLERPGLDREGTDEAIRSFERGLEHGRKTCDHFLIGSALSHLAYHTAWKSPSVDDYDERAQLLNKAFQYAKEAQTEFSIIAFVSPDYGFFWSGAPEPEYYLTLSRFEADTEKRRNLLEKAEKAASDTFKLAENSGYPESIGYAHHVMAKILLTKAQREKDSEEKKETLQRTLEHREKTVRLWDELRPGNWWDRGIMQAQLAETRHELVELTTDFEAKKRLLQESISNQEKAQQLLSSALIVAYGKEPPPSLLTSVVSCQHQYAYWLSSLHRLTGEKEHLKKALNVFEDMLESLLKLNIRGWTAECYWHIAQIYDDLGEYSESAENFEVASKTLLNAGEDISQLKDYYRDHALYMQAWAEIEKARDHHTRQDYGSAREHFEKAAVLHESTKRWSYMAPNYRAWTQVENAEDLSRKEQSEEAKQAFQKAIELFTEAENRLKTKTDQAETLLEEQIVNDVAKATQLRRRYCKARIAIEEGRILDKKGDHLRSSEKYASAVEILERTIRMSRSEQEQKELRLVVILSGAWQKMTLAEAEVSPELYVEASKLFEDAKELTTNEKARMLMLGHSRFCRALEAGMRFEDVRDPATYSDAIQSLESAANYYVRAGFQKSSEYAKATKLLFDAYMHIDNAEKERDQDRKARLYAIAEKLLQTSAGSFMKAEHPEKREQVMALLETVKEQKELAVSLTEVLHAPSIISTTNSFTTPVPTNEEAIGSERFERADVQANLIIRQRELRVGELLSLEMEFVNAGKMPALLIKVNEVIPQGCELAEKPEGYRVEDNYINMRGKRLDPFKVEEVKLIVKPKTQGTFVFEPTVLYLDENGKYRSHEPDPVTVTVKELGIKGWLKGEK